MLVTEIDQVPLKVAFLFLSFYYNINTRQTAKYQQWFNLVLFQISPARLKSLIIPK
jgi:hypothetical protein